MQLLQPRENLRRNIDRLPTEILNELNDFMEFLILKKSLKNTDMSKKEILEGLSESAKEMRLILEGKLKARPVEELLSEL